MFTNMPNNLKFTSDRNRNITRRIKMNIYETVFKILVLEIKISPALKYNFYLIILKITYF